VSAARNLARAVNAGDRVSEAALVNPEMSWLIAGDSEIEAVRVAKKLARLLKVGESARDAVLVTRDMP